MLQNLNLFQRFEEACLGIIFLFGDIWLVSKFYDLQILTDRAIVSGLNYNLMI